MNKINLCGFESTKCAKMATTGMSFHEVRTNQTHSLRWKEICINSGMFHDNPCLSHNKLSQYWHWEVRSSRDIESNVLLKMPFPFGIHWEYK